MTSQIPINIAVEDLLSEAVARRLMMHSGRSFSVGVVYNRGGNGYLKKTARGWNNAAKGIPFFLLTDLDSIKCPSLLRDNWLAGPAHSNLIFRVAVREVESWLLADPANLSTFFKVHTNRFPERPDEVVDPKATLISIAANSTRRQIKERVVPRPKSTAKQGRDYNACMTEFVMTKWDPGQAAITSPSLERCCNRLAAFRPVWT